MTITKKILSFAVTVTMLLQISSFAVPAFALDEETQTTDTFNYEEVRENTNLFKKATAVKASRAYGLEAEDSFSAFTKMGPAGELSAERSNNQAYNGDWSLLVKSPSEALTYVIAEGQGMWGTNKTYVSSVMVLGTEANASLIESETSREDTYKTKLQAKTASASSTSAIKAKGNNSVWIKDISVAPASTSATPDDPKIGKESWGMVYSCAEIGGGDLWSLGTAIYDEHGLSGIAEFYADDFYYGELIVANMDVTADKTEVTVPESGNATVALTATAYNQLGNTEFLALNESAPYTYEILSAPSGVTVSNDGVITVSEYTKVGISGAEVKVKVTANPTFLGADTQTDAQKEPRVKTVTIAVKPGENPKPKAKRVWIDGTLEKDATLTAEYEYWHILDDGIDEDSKDDTSKTEYFWYRYETALGEWKEINDGKKSFGPLTDDDLNYSYKVAVKPVSKGGVSGDVVESMIYSKSVPPVASNVKVSGDQEVGKTWNVDSYDYYDRNDEDEGIDNKDEAIYQWFRSETNSNDADKREVIKNANNKEYKITDADIGKYVYVGVKAVSKVDPKEAEDYCYSEPRLAAAYPTVTGVSIVKESNYLTVEYTYIHPLGIDPGEPIIEWYNDDTGELLGDGTSLNVSNLKGKTIRVEVTPIAVREPSKGKNDTDRYTVPNTVSSTVGGLGGGISVRPTTPVTPVEIKNVPSWAKDEIDYVLNNKIMEVASENDFAGGNQINRGEFMMAMLKAAGIQPNDYRGSFADVTSIDKFSGYLQAAFDQGVISAAENFYPTRELTRDEMCKIIVTSIEAMTKKEISKAGITHFTDYQNIQNWAIDFISQAVGTGIIKGNADGSVNPKGNVTRAEAAVVAKRIVEYVKAEGGLK